MIRFMEGILLRKAAEDVARVLSGAGHTVYFVGGCVRDRLLGYSVKDIDIATSARPDEVLRLFPDAWEVGAAFGVVLVRREGFSFEDLPQRRKLQGWPEAGGRLFHGCGRRCPAA